MQTGLAFLPLTLPFVLNPPLTARLMARYGPRPPILAGLGLLTAGGLVLGAGPAPYAWLALGLLLSGLGVSLVLPALATAVISAAPRGSAGAAGGVLNATRQAGAGLGVALMGAVGGASALWVSAAVCAAGAVWFAASTRRRVSLAVPAA